MKITQQISAYIEKSLIFEAELTPKPGLVDSNNNGSHTDMDISMFQNSAKVISPIIADCFSQGALLAIEPPKITLEAIRPVGLQAEKRMLQVTGGVNTHKGAIFAFGLLSAALGRLYELQHPISVKSLCQTVAQITEGIVHKELYQENKKIRTAGEYWYQKYGFCGARGEAASGFALVRQIALPVFRIYRQTEFSWLFVLLHLMAHNNDTNLLARGGLGGLRFTQRYARKIIRFFHFQPQLLTLDGIIEQLDIFDNIMILKQLSPGGSADLLAVSYFFNQIIHT